MSTSQRCRRAQGLRQEILSISKFNTGCVNHLFRSVAFWCILHRSYSLTRHMQLINIEARCSIAARWCPRPLWHRCYPISTFFASHSVQIVWFGFACLPSWPSLPAWAWFMSTCQQGRPEETWRNCVSFCFIVSTCFDMFRHVSTFTCHIPLHPSTFLCRILLKGSMSSLRCEPLPVHHGSPLLSLQAQLKSNTAILSFLAFLRAVIYLHNMEHGWTWMNMGDHRRCAFFICSISDIFWPQSGDCSAQQHSWHDHNRGYSEPWRAKDHVLFAILEDVAKASTCREREQTQFVSSFLQVLFWVRSVFNQTKQANCLLWIADYVMKMSMWWICDEYVCLLSLLYFESRNDLSFGLALCGIGRKSLPAGAD